MSISEDATREPIPHPPVLVREGDSFRDVVKHAKDEYWDFTIDPQECAAYRYMHSMYILALVYTAIITPYDIAFIPREDVTGALFYANQIVNLIFFIDLVLNFYVHYENGGWWVREHQLIVNHYLKGWFLFDLISSIPLSFIFYLLSTGEHASLLKFFSFLHVARLLKVWKLFGKIDVLYEYSTHQNWGNSCLALVRLGVVCILWTHWVACIFGATALYSYDHQLDESWMSQFITYPEIDDSSSIGINSYQVQYILSAYFAVMTLSSVGYGDISILNQTEYLVCMLVMVFGGFVWAYVVGQFSSAVAAEANLMRDYQKNYDNMNFMLTDLRIEHVVAREVREYMLHTHDIYRRNKYELCLKGLSDDLEWKVITCSKEYDTRMNSVYYMVELPSSVMLQIVRCLKGYVHAPNERMNRPETLHTIVSDGYVNQDGKIYTKNESFDREFICYSLDPAMHQFRAGCALSYVQVDALARDDFYRIIEASQDITKKSLKSIQYARVKYALKLSKSRLKVSPIAKEVSLNALIPTELSKKTYHQKLEETHSSGSSNPGSQFLETSHDDSSFECKECVGVDGSSVLNISVGL